MSAETESLKKLLWHAFDCLGESNPEAESVAISTLKVFTHNLATSVGLFEVEKGLDSIVVGVDRTIPKTKEESDGDPEPALSTHNGDRITFSAYARYMSDNVLNKLHDKQTGIVADILWMVCSKVYRDRHSGVGSAGGTAEGNAGGVTIPRPIRGKLGEQETRRFWAVFNAVAEVDAVSGEPVYPVVVHREEFVRLLSSFHSYIGRPWVGEESLVEAEVAVEKVFFRFVECLSLLERKFMEGLGAAIVRSAVTGLYDEYISSIYKKGCLSKRSTFMRTLQEKWFVLSWDALRYYSSNKEKEKRGEFMLDVVRLEPRTDHSFYIIENNKKHEIHANDIRTRNEWFEEISRAIKYRKSSDTLVMMDLSKRRKVRHELNKKEEERKQQREKAEQENQAKESSLQQAEEQKRQLEDELQRKQKELEADAEKMQELQRMNEELHRLLDAERVAKKEEEEMKENQKKLLEEEREKKEQLQKLKSEQDSLLEQERKLRDQLQLDRQKQEEHAEQERSLRLKLEDEKHRQAEDEKDIREQLEKERQLKEAMIVEEQKRREELEELRLEKERLLTEEKEKLANMAVQREQADAQLKAAKEKLQVAEDAADAKRQHIEAQKQRLRETAAGTGLARPIAPGTNIVKTTHRGLGAFTDDAFEITKQVRTMRKELTEEGELVEVMEVEAREIPAEPELGYSQHFGNIKDRFEREPLDKVTGMENNKAPFTPPVAPKPKPSDVPGVADVVCDDSKAQRQEKVLLVPHPSETGVGFNALTTKDISESEDSTVDRPQELPTTQSEDDAAAEVSEQEISVLMDEAISQLAMDDVPTAEADTPSIGGMPSSEDGPVSSQVAEPHTSNEAELQLNEPIQPEVGEASAVVCEESGIGEINLHSNEQQTGPGRSEEHRLSFQPTHPVIADTRPEMEGAPVDPQIEDGIGSMDDDAESENDVKPPAYEDINPPTSEPKRQVNITESRVNVETQPNVDEIDSGIGEGKPVFDSAETSVNNVKPASDLIDPVFDQPTVDQVKTGVNKPTVDQVKTGVDKPTVDQVKTGVDQSTVDEMEAGVDTPTVDEVKTGIYKPTVDEVETTFDKPTVDEMETGVDEPTADRVKTGVDKPTVDQVKTDVDIPTVDKMEAGVDTPTVDQVKTGVDTPTVDQVETGVDKPTVDEMEAGVDTPTVDQVETGVDKPTVDEMEAGVDTPTVGQVETGVDEPTVDQVKTGVDTPTVDQVETGVDKPTVDEMEAGVDEPAVDQVNTGVDTPTVDQMKTGVDKPTVDEMEAGVDTPTVDQVKTGVDTPTVDQVEAGVDQPTVDQMETGVDTTAVDNVETGVDTTAVDNVDTSADQAGPGVGSEIQQWDTIVDDVTLVAQAKPSVCEIKPPVDEIKPALDEVKPGGGQPEPVVDDTKPVVDEIKPAVDDVKPLVDKIKPDIDDVKPDIDEIKPPVDDINSALDEVNPDGGQPGSVVDDSKPAVDDVNPRGDEIKPDIGEIKPPVDEVKPDIDEIKPPVDEVKPPVDEVKPPVDEVKQPVDEVKPPVDEVKPPVDEIKPALGEVKSDGGQPEPAVDQMELCVTDARPDTCNSEPSVDDSKHGVSKPESSPGNPAVDGVRPATDPTKPVDSDQVQSVDVDTDLISHCKPVVTGEFNSTVHPAKPDDTKA